MMEEEREGWMIGKKNKKNDKREKEGSKSSGRKMGNRVKKRHKNERN